MIVNTRRLLRGATLIEAVESLNKGIQEKKQRLKDINQHSKDRKSNHSKDIVKVVGKSKSNLQVGQATTSEGENNNTKAEPVAGIARQVRRLSNSLAGGITSKMNSTRRRLSDESLPEDIEVGGGGQTDLRGSAFSYFNEPMPVQRQKAKGRAEGPLRFSAYSFFRRSSADEGSASDHRRSSIDEGSTADDVKGDDRPAIWVKNEGGDGAIDIREMCKELYG